jgi:hypothetical protein
MKIITGTIIAKKGKGEVSGKGVTRVKVTKAIMERVR